MITDWIFSGEYEQKLDNFVFLSQDLDDGVADALKTGTPEADKTAALRESIGEENLKFYD